MAESAAHIEYVYKLGTYVKDMLSSNEHVHILMDTPSSTDFPPHVVNNFRPDLYYNHNNRLIIGEAKTDDDFDRPHSIAQYKSYMEECKIFNGGAMIIFSCSWKVAPAFANLVRNIRRSGSYDVKVSIINELGLFRTIE